MPQKFTWERGPFTNCPACQRETFGILSSGGDVLPLRCTECRYSHSEVLQCGCEHQLLRDAFIRAGHGEREAGREVVRFWEWERLREVPHHRISSYLFAGLARRVVAGQRRVTRGFMNDVRAISAYAPYVEAISGNHWDMDEGDLISLTDNQTNWVIEFCMSWIKSSSGECREPVRLTSQSVLPLLSECSHWRARG